MDAEQDKITASGSIKVNIGDYESREAFASYSVTVQDGETPHEAYDRAAKVVDKVLASKERAMRIASEDDVDFDTMEKLSYHVSKDKKKKKKKKK